MTAAASAPTLRIPIALIARVVADRWGVEVQDLLGRRRGGEKFWEPRRAVYWLAQDVAGHGPCAIARRLGYRDHTTVLWAIDTARRRIETDGAFAAKVDEARAAIIALAATRESQRFRDADPVAAAERIWAHPNRNAMHVSVDETVAMATRLLALEEMAAAAYRLLATLDELERVKASSSARVGSLRAAHRRTVTLTTSAQALTGTLASTLAALGYDDTPDDEEPDNGEDQDARIEPACAAE